ncbi:MAG TPA: hypothetical protein VNY05_09680 [Candidatus Acidoferrales bacterium]|jgi:hypothetical protein|nr:hypothetical protein [Candidatus Acidoferrales bacterium]
MSNEDANELAAARHQTLIRSEKKIIGHEEGNDPELEPLFANHFELFQIGSDIYLDIGIVRPGDFMNLKEKIEREPSEVHSISFNVLQRVAMSRDGFERLKAGVDLITSGTKGEPIAD